MRTAGSSAGPRRTVRPQTFLERRAERARVERRAECRASKPGTAFARRAAACHRVETRATGNDAGSGSISGAGAPPDHVRSRPVVQVSRFMHRVESIGRSFKAFATFDLRESHPPRDQTGRARRMRNPPRLAVDERPRGSALRIQSSQNSLRRKADRPWRDFNLREGHRQSARRAPAARSDRARTPSAKLCACRRWTSEALGSFGPSRNPLRRNRR